MAFCAEFCDGTKPPYVSKYRKILLQLSQNLTKEEIEKLKHLSADFIPIAFLENISSGLQLFSAFERAALINEDKLDVLIELLHEIGREELVSRVNCYLLGSDEQTNQITHCKTGKETNDGILPVPSPCIHDTNSISDSANSYASSSHNPMSTKYSHEPIVLSRQEHCTGSVIDGSPFPPHNFSPKKQKNSDRKFINFLEFEGYIVEIIGGKHFSTPQGEFVELRNGCQYKIHATNTHVETCNLDIFIDGNDIGGWVLNGNEEITIERPVQEARKFAFYRVKLAPRDSGIKSGRDENGLIRCVFTPEKTLIVRLNAEGSSERVEVIVTPHETLGYLKTKIQEQLKLPVNPEQLLVLDGKLHQDNNSANLRDVIEDCGEHHARLIPKELMVTVKHKRSSFEILIDPTTATVGDIRRKIAVNIGAVSLMRTIRIWQGGILSTTPTDPLPQVLIFQQHPCLIVESSDEDIFQDDLTIIVELLKENIVLDVNQKITIADVAKSLQSTLPVRQQSLMKDSRIVFYHKGVRLDPLIHKEPLSFLPITNGDVLSAKIESCHTRVKLKMPDECVFSTYANLSSTLSDLVDQIPRQYKPQHSCLQAPRVLLSVNGKLLDPAKDREILGAYGLTNDMIVTVIIEEKPQFPDSSDDNWSESKSEDDEVWSDTEGSNECYRREAETKSSSEDSFKGVTNAKASRGTFLKNIKRKFQRPLDAFKCAAAVGQKARTRGSHPISRAKSHPHRRVVEEEVWTNTSKEFGEKQASNAHRSLPSGESQLAPPPPPPPPVGGSLPLRPPVEHRDDTMHAVMQGKYVPPAVTQGRYSPPVVRQGRYSPPVVSQGRYSPPLVSEGRYSPPLVSQGRYSPPFVSQGRYSPPLVSQERYSPPVVRQGTYSPQAGLQGRDFPPAVTQGRDSPPPMAPLLPPSSSHVGHQVPPPPPLPPTHVTHKQRGALMESIRAGTTLRKVEEKALPNRHDLSDGTLAQALKMGLNRKATFETQKKRVRVRVVQQKDKESRKEPTVASGTKRFVNDDPAWRAGATTLQGVSEQQFKPALSVRGDSSRTAVLILRLVARDDEELGPTPIGEGLSMSNYGLKTYTAEQSKEQWRESVRRESRLIDKHILNPNCCSQAVAETWSIYSRNLTKDGPPRSLNYFNNTKKHQGVSTYDRLFKIQMGYCSKLHRDDREFTRGLNVNSEERSKAVPVLSSSQYGLRASLESPFRKHVRVATVKRDFYRDCGTNIPLKTGD